MKTTDIILQKIKREGAVTAKALSDDLGLTTMGVRQHLQALEDDGLLSTQDIRVKVGRPTRHWSLTAAGHDQFTDRHKDLTISLIDSIQALFGEEGLKKVVAQREENTLKQYQEAIKDCTNLKAKLDTLTYLREREGYMAELVEDGEHYILIENHCPICHAAKKCPALCSSEKNLFKRLLGDQYQIKREEHIVEGQRRCTYRIGEQL